MTDLVERLRARPLHVPTASRDMAEAADEIERLRAELNPGQVVHADYAAEAERLRLALRIILQKDPRNGP